MNSPHARPSQFVRGDKIRHVDSPDTMTVIAITYIDGLPYLHLEGRDGYGMKETVQGVLDTKDLRRADGRPTIYDREPYR